MIPAHPIKNAIDAAINFTIIYKTTLEIAKIRNATGVKNMTHIAAYTKSFWVIFIGVPSMPSTFTKCLNSIKFIVSAFSFKVGRASGDCSPAGVSFWKNESILFYITLILFKIYSYGHAQRFMIRVP